MDAIIHIEDGKNRSLNIPRGFNPGEYYVFFDGDRLRVAEIDSEKKDYLHCICPPPNLSDQEVNEMESNISDLEMTLFTDKHREYEAVRGLKNELSSDILNNGHESHGIHIKKAFFLVKHGLDSYEESPFFVWTTEGNTEVVVQEDVNDTAITFPARMIKRWETKHQNILSRDSKTDFEDTWTTGGVDGMSIAGTDVTISGQLKVKDGSIAMDVGGSDTSKDDIVRDGEK